MKFQFEKFGYFEKKTEIELSDLTIICGKNNTGKTYVSYAIYGFLEYWKENIRFNLTQNEIENLIEHGIIELDLQQFEKQISTVLDELSKRYTQLLPTVFSANETYFSDSIFRALISADYKANYYPHEMDLHLAIGKKNILKFLKEKDSDFLKIISLVEDKNLILSIIKNSFHSVVGQTLLANYFANPFIITSERTGVSLFHRELDRSKNVWADRLQAQSKRLEPTHLVNPLAHTDFFQTLNEPVSRYALPIKEEIDFMRDIFEYSKKKSPLLKAHPTLAKLLNEIVGGDYQINQEQIYFTFAKGESANQEIPLYMGSSAIKSLLDLSLYINHIAKKGDILLIDEPEQNLHPANQRKIARLLVRLLKMGIKVFITTHSDYLIKELNNLIILGNPFEDRNEIMTKYQYTEDDVLDKSSVRVYIAEKQTLVPAPINDLGITLNSFDLEVREMNDLFDEMTMTMEIAYQ
jgi:predicted ATPase